MSDDGLTFIKAASLATPAGEVQWEGDIEWISVGSHRYPVEPTYWGRDNAFVFSDSIGPITGGVRVDGHGVEWHTEDPSLVDRPTLYTTGELWDADSWLNQNTPCDANVYNGESRTSLSSLPTNHKLDDAVVVIDVGGAGHCSGVMVGPRDVLTNAHCVTVNNGPAMRTVEAICSRGNRSLYGGADCVSKNSAGINGNFTVTVNSAWMAGVTNFGTDWALIEWGPWDPDADFDPNPLVNLDVQQLFNATPIPITTRNAASVEADQVGQYGHPASILSPGGTCIQQIQSGNAFEDPQFPFGVKMVREWRTDHWHDTTKIKTRIDAGGGQSGSPYLQCTQTNCVNNSEEIVGLHAGFYHFPGLTSYTGGPRANQFAGWVSIFLPGD